MAASGTKAIARENKSPVFSRALGCVAALALAVGLVLAPQAAKSWSPPADAPKPEDVGIGTDQGGSQDTTSVTDQECNIDQPAIDKWVKGSEQMRGLEKAFDVAIKNWLGAGPQGLPPVNPELFSWDNLKQDKFRNDALQTLNDTRKEIDTLVAKFYAARQRKKCDQCFALNDLGRLWRAQDRMNMAFGTISRITIPGSKASTNPDRSSISINTIKKSQIENEKVQTAISSFSYLYAQYDKAKSIPVSDFSDQDVKSDSADCLASAPKYESPKCTKEILKTFYLPYYSNQLLDALLGARNDSDQSQTLAAIFASNPICQPRNDTFYPQNYIKGQNVGTE